MDTGAFIAQLKTSFPSETIAFDEVKGHVKIGEFSVRATTFEGGVVCYTLLDKASTVRLVVTKYPSFVDYVTKYLNGIPLVEPVEVPKPVVPEKQIIEHHCGHCLKTFGLETTEDLISYERTGRLVHRVCHEKTLDLVAKADKAAQETAERRKAALNNISRPVLCNQCGGSCEKGREGLSVSNYGLIRAEVNGGYESTSLTDGTRYTFSICEGCLLTLFGTFKIPAERTCYFDETPIDESTPW